VFFSVASLNTLLALIYIVYNEIAMDHIRYVTVRWWAKKQETELMLTNLRDAFTGQSRSSNIVPFHILGIVSNCAIVTLSLRRAVFTIYDFKKYRDLEIGVRGH